MLKLRLRAGLLVAILGVMLLSAEPVLRASADPPQPRDIVNIGDPIDAPLTPAQEAADERFRQTFGFDSDPIYIASLYARVANGTLPGANRSWGALLTADEAAEMMTRQRLVELTRLPAFHAYVAAYSSEFGGEYFDQAAGGAVTVLFTANIDAHRSALSSILGSAARLRVVQVAHTEDELDRFARRVSADLVWLRDHGVAVTSFGPEVPANTVAIRVQSVTPAVLAVLQARYPGKPWRAVTASPARLLGETATEAPPMMGALRIWNNVEACRRRSAVRSRGSCGYKAATGLANGGAPLRAEGTPGLRPASHSTTPAGSSGREM